MVDRTFSADYLVGVTVAITDVAALVLVGNPRIYADRGVL
ncbi:hypothetical protein ABH944_007779 [Caballeronia udeis]|uniref:Uncharacterized protein n=1 Tax=Caballeronia udeis TaxID=1232866 RepID=A0ABW8MUT4_9BURK